MGGIMIEHYQVHSDIYSPLWKSFMTIDNQTNYMISK